MTTAGTRVAGHKRTLRATGTRSQGMFTTASGYATDCACGWSSTEFSATENAVAAHTAHKVDVLTGVYAARVAAERERRAANYRKLLAEIDRDGEKPRGLTREQVQSWLDQLPTARIAA